MRRAGWFWLLVAVSPLAALPGCASDNAQFACPGFPSRPLCLPTSEIYRLTDGAGPPPASERRPSVTTTTNSGSFL
ncbi:conjugal transfer protein TraV [uncultured Thiodictyon sp.]|uniref:conjugal transfer protein TraV n=1 Tax=uncultured Thiodictyon sp. TaxID=1846217 RepID=UPI0025DC9946|nr:conjugal transfer protein TraV [uncultured Thiodictyon sp.]